MKATLENLGSGLEDVIKTTIYLTDPRHADGYREGVRNICHTRRRAPLIMGVQLAETEMLIEIEAVAVISEKTNAMSEIVAGLRDCTDSL